MANTFSQIYVHIVFAVKGRDSIYNSDTPNGVIGLIRNVPFTIITPLRGCLYVFKKALDSISAF